MPRQPSSEGSEGSLESTVAGTFSEDSAFSAGDQGGEDSQLQPSEMGGDDSPPSEAREPAQRDDGLPDFEKFLRDSERRTEPTKGDKQPAQPQPDQRTRPDRYEQDQRGNIIDPRTGKVLARSGAEARLYMDARRARMDAFNSSRERDELRGHLQTAVNFIDQYRAQVSGLQQAGNLGERLGLQPVEAADAMQMMSRLKRGGADGLQAVKEILTRAAAAGIDVQSLGVGAGGIDVKSIVDQIRNEFAPIRGDLEARRQAEINAANAKAAQDQAWNNAAAHTVDFFQQNADAVPYAPVIEKALNDPRFRGWSLREVWQAIQLHLARQGGSSAQTDHREIPRGGRMPPNGAGGVNQVAHPSTSYADLVNQILDEAGVQ